MAIEAVLFDLDGTLLDTAPDLLAIANKMRQRHASQFPPLTLEKFRPYINHGAKGMLKFALEIDSEDAQFQHLKTQFIDEYQNLLTQTNTTFFPKMERVLAHLEKENISWGIVTNKLTKPTNVLLNSLNLHKRPACIICGDTLPTYKPDPAPILHAVHLLQKTPDKCLYVGDAITDMMASKSAGTKGLVALYGYISEQEDPYAWRADGYVKEPLEILEWL